MDDFAVAFNDADAVIVTEVYAAGETPIEGVSGEALVESIRARGHRDVSFVADRAAALVALEARLKAGDIALTLGAGDVTKLGPELVAQLQARASKGAS